MKNFVNEENKRSTIANGKIDESATFVKAMDYVGEYEQDQLCIRGFMKTKSEQYGDQYVLYVEDYREAHDAHPEDPTDSTVEGVKYLLMNIPKWYGAKIEEDFQASGQSADEYFWAASIKAIKKWKTKFGTYSLNITSYTTE